MLDCLFFFGHEMTTVTIGALSSGSPEIYIYEASGSGLTLRRKYFSRKEKGHL